MTELSFYRQFLGAQWLRTKLVDAGLTVQSVHLNSDHWVSQKSLQDVIDDDDLNYGFMFHIEVQIRGFGAEWVETTANTILEEVSGARVFRENGLVYLYGVTPGHPEVRWQMSLGTGVCERVLVGTRTEMKPDPNIVVPLVEVEVPVYEVRCVDPLAELVR